MTCIATARGAGRLLRCAYRSDGLPRPATPREPVSALPMRLILSGFILEAVYIVGFIRPYNLLAWLPSPAQDLGTLSGAQDLGTLSGATPRSVAAYLVSVAVLVGGYVTY